VRNAGDATAGAFTATLTRSAGTPLTFRVDSLSAGASTTLDYACRRIEERTLTIDASNEVTESDESDNVQQFTSDCA